MAVYLLHFAKPHNGARHYVGFSADPEGPWRRIAAHRAGRGARFMARVNGAGIAWDVVRVWPHSGRALERALKRGRRLRDHCPACRKDATTSAP